MPDLSTGSPKAAEQATDDRIIELFHDGCGRNQISRTVGVTTYRVDQVCKGHGLTFDASRTADAVAVRTASAGEQRRQLAGRFRSVAEVALNHADEHSDDAAELFGWIKAAGTAVDKDLAIQTQLDRVDDHSSMADTMQQFQAFGELVRGAAAAQDRDDVPP